MTQQTTIAWLRIASLVLIGFGVLGLTGSIPALAAGANFFADLAFWPVDGLPANSVPEVRLFWAVTGGILAGWGVLFWLIATRLYAKEPALSRSMILISIGTWFVIDSVGSILAGAPVNALLNVGFLLLFVIPLWRPSHHARVAEQS